MSGGSFDYLCHADFPVRRDDLERMRDELEKLAVTSDHPGAWRAYDETVELLVQPSDELRAVWRSVEWWRSGDYGLDQVIEQLRKFHQGES